MGMTVNNQETALYDRQIRLYGLAAQQKILRSKVAIYGEWNLIAQEIVKNLCLNGLESVHIISSSNPGDSSANSGMFGALGSESQQKIIDMNPGVDVKLYLSASSDSLRDLLNLNHYSHVIYVGYARDDATDVSEFCHAARVGFSWVFDHGSSSYLINDFGEHFFIIRNKNAETNEETVLEEKCHFSSLKASMAQLISTLDKEKLDLDCFSPSLASIIGAIASQESIKFICAENRPINGLLRVHGNTLEATILKL